MFQIFRMGASLAVCAVLVVGQSQPDDGEKRFSPVFGGRRLALVIGNKSYSWKPLVNPINDANAVAQALADLGFARNDIHLVLDANRETLRRVKREFVESIRPGDLAFAYYSGHGVEVQGANYLLPIDLPSDSSEEYVQDEAVSAQNLLREMEQRGAKAKVLILDACRDNPLRATKSTAGGLAPMEGKGSLILFATEAGRTASDTPGSANSVFTHYLIEGLRRPGVPLDEVMKGVARNVARATNDKQVPSMYGLMLEDLVLLKANAPAPPPPAPAPALRPALDQEAWDAVRNSTDPNAFQQFILEYPQSGYVGVARVKIAALKAPVSIAAAAPPKPPAFTPAPAAIIDRGPQPGSSKVNAKDGQRYVWIPPGNFIMGCSPGDTECGDDEKPEHPVSITKGFWLGQTPVTQGAYRRVTGTNPSNYQGENLPVEKVTWDEAKHYCEAVGGRLPTEAEWEYAARAGTAGARYRNPLDEIAWYNGNSGGKTHPVGTKASNAWNLYDMLGNVWQWTADKYGEYEQKESGDPQGPASGQDHVLRGGARVNEPKEVRVSSRFNIPPSNRAVSVGFRCVGE